MFALCPSTPQTSHLFFLLCWEVLSDGRGDRECGWRVKEEEDEEEEQKELEEHWEEEEDEEDNRDEKEGEEVDLSSINHGVL